MLKAFRSYDTPCADLHKHSSLLQLCDVYARVYVCVCVCVDVCQSVFYLIGMQTFPIDKSAYVQYRDMNKLLILGATSEMQDLRPTHKQCSQDTN